MIRTDFTVLFVLAATVCATQQKPVSPETAEIERQIRAAQAAYEAGRLDEAAAAYEAITRRYPNLAEAHAGLGLVRHEQFRYPEAIPELEKALQLKPGLVNIRAVVGLEYFQVGRISSSVEELEKAVKADPANPEFNGWLGMAYVAAGRFRPAVAKLEVAVQAKPKSALFLAYLVRAYGGATDQTHEQLAKMYPGSPEGHIALAQAYAVTGNRDMAVEEYQAALAINPKLFGVNRAVGDIHAELGQFAEAEAAYRKELENGPGIPDNEFRLGLALAELGRDDEALPHLKRAVKLDPENGEALAYLGRVYLDLDRFGEAVETLLKALDLPLGPSRLAATHYQLWTAYRKLGKQDEADRHFQLFKKLEAEQATQRKELR